MSQLMLKHVDRRVVKRVALILAPLPSTSSKTLKSTVLQLLGSSARVNAQLDNSITKLWNMSERPIPSVTCQMRRDHGQNPDIGIYLDVTLQDTRAVVDCINLDNVDLSKLLANGISHLAIISLDNKTAWNFGNNPSTCHVNVSKDSVVDLIHDILLDIALFRSYPFLGLTYLSSPDKKIEFSEKKLAYARINNLMPFGCGVLPENGGGYFSFASACREASGIDYTRYLKLWDEFVKHEIVDPDNVPTSNNDRKILVDHIISNHRKGGSFSKRKLLAEITKLSVGSHVLICTDHKPNRKKDVSNIAKLFKRRNWSTCLWKIVPFNEINKHLQYSHFVSFFKFYLN